ncbi:MAG: ABC transporter permease [Nitrospirae bacterium]|nr:ABC transporter permease [Nitrospirota bacterium]MBI3606029.1 ABC transporter permease [Nitrospirota bacterium]
MKIYRVMAVVYRHLSLYKRSLTRLMEIIYWPVLDLMVWGFVTLYLQKFQGGLPPFIAFFLGALILWDIFFRAQQGISISFLEEVWSRNLLNLFVSPLTPLEFIAGTLVISLIKVVATFLVTMTLAYIFYSFNVFSLGFPLFLFLLNLILMGWSIGIMTTGAILRFGQEAEVMAWGLAFLFQPVSAVFYPVAVLPPVLQKIAWWIPSSHVFEGMREVINQGGFPAKELIWAFGLNGLYILGAGFFFSWMLREVKEKGLLLKSGE